MLSRQRELCRTVVESRWSPGVGRMARFTSVVQDSNDVVWIRRLLIVALVTRKTVRILQRVVVIDMAELTLSDGVLSNQRKIGGVVIEGSRLPGRGAVALCTKLRIAQGLVIWIARVRIVGSMAVNAIGCQSRVLIVHVAVFAYNSSMSACQREFRCVVIERSRGPNTGRMACPALMSETRDNMDRACRTRIVGLMTLEAIGVGQLIVAIDVAQLTLSRRMSSCQSELCAAMVERGRQPGVGGVA